MNKIDLNLLKVLEILLEERHVSATAKRLHLTQSAVSKHLAKLREIFDDPLFERTAKGLKPTPRAQEIAPKLRLITQQLEQVIRPVDFDPFQSHRQFKIHMVNAAYSLTLPFLMPDLLKQAPNVQLKAKAWNESSLHSLINCEVDMGIACREWDERSPEHVESIPDELNYIELTREHSMCLVSEDHPALKQHWDLNTFLQYRHIQVLFGGSERWLLDDVLAIKRLERDIAISMPDFHSAMSLCEQSELILCAPAHHVAKMASNFRLRILELPIKLEPGAYVLLWHKHFEQDHGHKWLRNLIIHSNPMTNKTN